MLRADGLVYQEVEDLLDVGFSLNPNIKTFDAACFDGHYVTGEQGSGCWWCAGCRAYVCVWGGGCMPVLLQV